MWRTLARHTGSSEGGRRIRDAYASVQRAAQCAPCGLAARTLHPALVSRSFSSPSSSSTGAPEEEAAQLAALWGRVRPDQIVASVAPASFAADALSAEAAAPSSDAAATVADAAVQSRPLQWLMQELNILGASLGLPIDAVPSTTEESQPAAPESAAPPMVRSPVDGLATQRLLHRCDEVLTEIMSSISAAPQHPANLLTLANYRSIFKLLCTSFTVEETEGAGSVIAGGQAPLQRHVLLFAHLLLVQAESGLPSALRAPALPVSVDGSQQVASSSSASSSTVTMTSRRRALGAPSPSTRDWANGPRLQRAECIEARKHKQPLLRIDMERVDEIIAVMANSPPPPTAASATTGTHKKSSATVAPSSPSSSAASSSISMRSMRSASMLSELVEVAQGGEASDAREFLGRVQSDAPWEALFVLARDRAQKREARTETDHAANDAAQNVLAALESNFAAMQQAFSEEQLERIRTKQEHSDAFDALRTEAQGLLVLLQSLLSSAAQLTVSEYSRVLEVLVPGFHLPTFAEPLYRCLLAQQTRSLRLWQASPQASLPHMRRTPPPSLHLRVPQAITDAVLRCVAWGHVDDISVALRLLQDLSTLRHMCPFGTEAANDLLGAYALQVRANAQAGTLHRSRKGSLGWSVRVLYRSLRERDHNSNTTLIQSLIWGRENIHTILRLTNAILKDVRTNIDHKMLVCVLEAITAEIEKIKVEEQKKPAAATAAVGGGGGSSVGSQEAASSQTIAASPSSSAAAPVAADQSTVDPSDVVADGGASAADSSVMPIVVPLGAGVSDLLAGASQVWAVATERNLVGPEVCGALLRAHRAADDIPAMISWIKTFAETEKLAMQDTAPAATVETQAAVSSIEDIAPVPTTSSATPLITKTQISAADERKHRLAAAIARCVRHPPFINGSTFLEVFNALDAATSAPTRTSLDGQEEKAKAATMLNELLAVLDSVTDSAPARRKADILLVVAEKMFGCLFQNPSSAAADLLARWEALPRVVKLSLARNTDTLATLFALLSSPSLRLQSGMMSQPDRIQAAENLAATIDRDALPWNADEIEAWMECYVRHRTQQRGVATKVTEKAVDASLSPSSSSLPFASLPPASPPSAPSASTSASSPSSEVLVVAPWVSATNIWINMPSRGVVATAPLYARLACVYMSWATHSHQRSSSSPSSSVGAAGSPAELLQKIPKLWRTMLRNNSRYVGAAGMPVLCFGEREWSLVLSVAREHGLSRQALLWHERAKEVQATHMLNQTALEIIAWAQKEEQALHKSNAPPPPTATSTAAASATASSQPSTSSPATAAVAAPSPSSPSSSSSSSSSTPQRGSPLWRVQQLMGHGQPRPTPATASSPKSSDVASLLARKEQENDEETGDKTDESEFSHTPTSQSANAAQTRASASDPRTEYRLFLPALNELAQVGDRAQAERVIAEFDRYGVRWNIAVINAWLGCYTRPRSNNGDDKEQQQKEEDEGAERVWARMLQLKLVPTRVTYSEFIQCLYARWGQQGGQGGQVDLPGKIDRLYEDMLRGTGPSGSPVAFVARDFDKIIKSAHYASLARDGSGQNSLANNEAVKWAQRAQAAGIWKALDASTRALASLNAQQPQLGASTASAATADASTPQTPRTFSSARPTPTPRSGSSSAEVHTIWHANALALHAGHPSSSRYCKLMVACIREGSAERLQQVEQLYAEMSSKHTGSAAGRSNEPLAFSGRDFSRLIKATDKQSLGELTHRWATRAQAAGMFEQLEPVAQRIALEAFASATASSAPAPASSTPSSNAAL